MTGKPVEEYVADTIGGSIPKGYVELVDPDDSSYIKLRYYGWMVMDDVGNSRDNVSNRLVVSVIESIPGHDREAYLLALEVYTSSGYHQFVLMISEDDTLFEPMTSLDDWEWYTYPVFIDVREWVNVTIVLENSVDGLYVKWLVNDTIVREYTSSSIVLENFTEATIGLYDNSIGNGSLLVDHMRIDIDNTTVFNIDYSYWIGGQHGYIIDSCGGPSINYVVETTPPISEPIEVVIIVVSLIVMTLIAIVKAGSRSFSR